VQTAELFQYFPRSRIDFYLISIENTAFLSRWNEKLITTASDLSEKRVCPKESLAGRCDLLAFFYAKGKRLHGYFALIPKNPDQKITVHGFM